MGNEKDFKLFFRMSGFVLTCLFLAFFIRFFYQQHYLSSKIEEFSTFGAWIETQIIREQQFLKYADFTKEDNTKPYITQVDSFPTQSPDELVKVLKQELGIQITLPLSSRLITDVEVSNESSKTPIFYIIEPSSSHLRYAKVNYKAYLDKLVHSTLGSSPLNFISFNFLNYPIYASQIGTQSKLFGFIEPSNSAYDLSYFQNKNLSVYKFDTKISNNLTFHLLLSHHFLHTNFQKLTLPFVFMFAFMILAGTVFIYKYSRLNEQLNSKLSTHEDFNSLIKSLIKNAPICIIIANRENILFINQKAKNVLTKIKTNKFVLPNPAGKDVYTLEIEGESYEVFQDVINFNQLPFTLQIFYPHKETSQEIQGQSDPDFKHQLIDKISQNLRIPLNSLLGMIVFLKDSELNEDQKENIQVVEEMGILMNDILDDLIDISDLDLGNTKSKNLSFDLRGLMQSIHSFHLNKIEYKDLNFEMEIDEKLPQLIISDKAKIRQILNQLLENAIAFTSFGEVKLNVKVIDKERIKFIVEDTGIGIPREKLRKINSEIEHIADLNSMRVFKNGLGLKVAQLYCQALGSKLIIKSLEEIGTKVSFELKMTESDQKHIVDLIANPTMPINLNNPEKVHLLIVEDNKINMKITKKLLEKLKIKNITIAENGREALTKVQTQHFDVILMDCNMPVMDGYQATKALREQGVMTPIIALTASVSETDISRCMDCGMNNHVAKPIQLDSLKEILSKYLKT